MTGKVQRVEREKNKTYNEIEEMTGASTATISRINRCLHYGADGYNTIIDRMKEHKESSL